MPNIATDLKWLAYQIMINTEVLANKSKKQT